MKNKFDSYWLIIGVILGLSCLIALVTWVRMPADFPFIVRTNVEGLRYLGERYLVWLIPVIAAIFVLLNQFIVKYFFRSNKRLNKLVLFANIGIVLLTLIISIQWWWLNT